MNESTNIQWGVKAQTGVLTDVLLGKPDHFRWVALNSISAVNQANQARMGYQFDKQRAMRQHREMVEAYEANGVRCTLSKVMRDCPVVCSLATPAS